MNRSAFPNQKKKGSDAMKNEKELNALKEEIAALSAKLSELTDEELEQVIGGTEFPPADFSYNSAFNKTSLIN